MRSGKSIVFSIALGWGAAQYNAGAWFFIIHYINIEYVIYNLQKAALNDFLLLSQAYAKHFAHADENFLLK